MAFVSPVSLYCVSLISIGISLSLSLSQPTVAANHHQYHATSSPIIIHSSPQNELAANRRDPPTSRMRLMCNAPPRCQPIHR